MRLLKILVMLLCSNIAIATMGQHIENIAMVLNEEIITITYDLVDIDQGANTFDLQVFASHDGFSSALNLVAGDIRA